ncbi:SusC/RagA family TonB-linked outer membrane protein [Flavobacterium granuli]|uniref:TonB-linked SusC/RagA family outer membrane protein n=1 Tax=Flavobacterium granuli TaxID=280093 RepID=A0A1M5KK76_9FLAO|nr:TonB-dependent receptor [Flavobacterium granuli]PRZ26329.1 TonB-linked SusC/RagA family outer membrane protein [Flavobacterium granuli]SHG53254.1 TonB-linked outer membrane protein, SusC/RagA family [Flavobacterium granuli]
MKHSDLLIRRLFYVLLLVCLWLPNATFAQKNNSETKNVSGRITDITGNGLPGVNVLVKDTKIGVNTDIDGKYSISIPASVANPTLVFSYLGYAEKTEILNNRKEVSLVLQEGTNKLDEVVVIGYGSIKKGNVTGAISSIKKESIETRATTNPAEALQGLVAGVNVQKNGGNAGSGVNVKIRGVNTFGNNEPLYIIDGFQGSISTVNPTNIESIEVLKDGAAAAIYGSVAANGVVIITTKNGQKEGIKVDFSSFLNSTVTAKRLDLLNADQYRTVHKKMYDEYNKYSNNPVTLPAYITSPSPYDTNWQDEVFRTGLAQNYGLGIQGREGDIKFALYGNYAKEKGIIIDNNFGQQNASARVSFKKSIFDVDAKMAYIGTKSEQPNFQLKEVYTISPLVPVLDPSQPYGYGLTDKNGLPSGTNPVADEHFRDRVDNGQDLTANIAITANILPWLKFKTAYSYRVKNNQQIAHFPPFIADSKAPHNYALQNEVRSHWDEQILDNILSADRTFGAHSINAMVGSTINAASSNWNNVTVEGKTTDYTVINGQLVSNEHAAGFLDPNFATIGAGKGGTYSADGSKYQYNRLSYFGRVNYSYKDRYLAQATMRYDGSSKFGKDSRWGAFPSVALGWKIDQEDFFPKEGIVSTVKLRASWGQLGNEAALGYYSSNSLINSGNYLNSGYVQGSGSNPWPGSIATALENRTLQWETTDSKNIGIDYTLKNKKISGSINYYRNVTDKLLITKKLAPSAGIDDPILNVGKISNSGFEFEINYREQSNAFKYNVGFNFSTLRNNVESLANADQAINGEGLKYGDEHFPTQARVGRPISSFYLYRTDGIFQSDAEVASYTNSTNDLLQPNAKPGDIRFKDLNNDGVIDENDKEFAGTGLPKLEANLNLGANYMGFDFSALFGSAWGNKLYNGNRYFFESMSSGTNMLASTLNSWTPENQSSTPRAVLGDPNGNSRESDRFLENGNFIRLRQLQLGYSLPKKWLEAAKIDKLRFYVSGENLLTITKYKGIDPEFARTSILDSGVDRFVFPFTKSFVFGVQYIF